MSLYWLCVSFAPIRSCFVSHSESLPGWPNVSGTVSRWRPRGPLTLWDRLVIHQCVEWKELRFRTAPCTRVHVAGVRWLRDGVHSSAQHQDHRQKKRKVTCMRTLKRCMTFGNERTTQSQNHYLLSFRDYWLGASGLCCCAPFQRSRSCLCLWI